MRTRILTHLYEEYLTCGPYAFADVDQWAHANDADIAEVRITVDELVEEGRAEWLPAIGAHMAHLTPLGVHGVEQEGMARAEAAEAMTEARLRLLLRLAELRDKHGPHHGSYWEKVAAEASLTRLQYDQSVYVLASFGFMEGDDRPTVTRSGLEAVRSYREGAEVKAELGELEQGDLVTPQERGRRLERLIARSISDTGWETAVNVRSATEENDIVVHQEREIYLIQCKWEAHPIGAPMVRDMIGRLGARDGVPGLLLSMSGFAATAVDEARLAFGRQLVLLWGPTDVRSILADPWTFESLLQSKLYAARVRRKVLLEGQEH